VYTHTHTHTHTHSRTPTKDSSGRQAFFFTSNYVKSEMGVGLESNRKLILWLYSKFKPYGSLLQYILYLFYGT